MPERAGAPRGQQVPDAVADHVDPGRVDAEPVDRRQEQVRVRLGVGHHVARDDRHAVRHAELGEHRPGRLHPAAGGDAPGQPTSVSRRSSATAPGSGRTSSDMRL